MSKLDGPAKKKVQSLAAALEADNTALINQRWGGLRRMLGRSSTTTAETSASS